MREMVIAEGSLEKTLEKYLFSIEDVIQGPMTCNIFGGNL